MDQNIKGNTPNNPNELTIENSVLILIDFQLAIAMISPSLRPEILINNVTGLAKTAKALGIPTILTTVGAKNSILADPLFKELRGVFPDNKPIDRTSTHAWSHPEVRKAVETTGRKKLVMAGIATEVCLAQSVFSALQEGFDVYFVSDCSTGTSQEAHDDAKTRMTMAGAKPITWLAVLSEWTPEINSPERAALTDVVSQHGGASGLWVDYVLEQVKAGIVKATNIVK